jgi:DNA polymerase I-like protein with 3'-5' exonuclease and polymerase domains
VTKLKKNSHVGGFQLAMFAPESGWVPPTELPDLRGRKYLGIDVEAKDPNLMKMGPGYIRGDARAVGISLATEDTKLYLPFGHEQGGNMDKDLVVRYVKDQVSDASQDKVGANLLYEMEALASLGIEMRGRMCDVQVAAPILDENRKDGNSLEALCQSYLGHGKDEKKLLKAAADYNLDPKKDLWRMHSKYVGEYAESDADYPIHILKKQLVEIENEKLNDIWDLETQLTPVLWKMRARGIRVDLDAAEVLSRDMKTEEDLVLARIWDQTGYKVDPWSSKSLAVFMNQMGLGFHVKYTTPTKAYPQGQPSFKNEWFGKMAKEDPIFGLLRDYRVMGKIRRDFVEGMILDNHVRGRLHPQWHQLKQDDEDRENGTETGRIASSKPNLTNIPVRDPKWGKKMRSLFIADEGGKYCKNDYSQQEPRIMVHFAYLKRYPGAAEVRKRYIDDPSTSYHRLVEALIREKTGRPLDPDAQVSYRIAKDINLGSAYGMGTWKLALKLGISYDEAKSLLKVFHQGVPYVKKLEERCMEIVQAQGFIRTVLGRKRRFNEWEPKNWELKKQTLPVDDYELAVDKWGADKIERAHAHTALNSICQGSAADQTKRAIILLDQIGLTPQIQVYDELGQTIYDDKDAWRIKEVMEHAIEFEVPHLADPDVGRSWGETKEMVE